MPFLFVYKYPDLLKLQLEAAVAQLAQRPLYKSFSKNIL
jgi:hypothetical protein